ncbi:hypothetical protein BN903_48 [Halorubrum sp. AJ67]|nr:hypothetical protein BN903_48 [Halorubrum sp. AJ67]
MGRIRVGFASIRGHESHKIYKPLCSHPSANRRHGVPRGRIQELLLTITG